MLDTSPWGDEWQTSPANRRAYQRIDEALETVPVPRGGPVLELLPGEPLEVPGLDAELEALRTDGILVLRGREILLERYFNGMTPSTRHLLQSVTKSLCAAVVGRFVDRGQIDVGRPIGQYVPELLGSAYGDATVQQALDMAVAVAYDETYDDLASDVNTHDRVSGWKQRRADDPEGIEAFLPTLLPTGEHGRTWFYCSANTDVLAWVLERVSGRRFSELLSTELWSRIGAEHDAFITVDAHGFSLASGGGCVTLRDLARFGRVLLDGGVGPAGDQVIPRAWVEEMLGGAQQDLDVSGMPESLAAPTYRNQFWHTGDEHRCAFGVGIFGQFVWVNPATDPVVAKLSTLDAADDPDAFAAHVALLDRLSRS
ncbi:MAG TPA: serine hydrolase domain-containing protein [Candidatus Nanopelagicales bacterium]|nr:serine hydrolase domain-containing protein [Candidatus Nanopelagicales bacterium]